MELPVLDDKTVKGNTDAADDAASPESGPANISLVSATTRHKVIIDVASSVGVTTGTIVIKQASGGKAVTIEGLAISLN